MTEHELLVLLFGFFVDRSFICPDDDSVMDMVKRYRFPPVTKHQRIAMQMTVSDYKTLCVLLETIKLHLYPPPTEQPAEETVDESV